MLRTTHRLWVTLLVLATACGGSDEVATPPLETTPPVDVPAEPSPPPDEVEPPPRPLPPHGVLLVVVHEAPLLPSEQRILGVITERLHLRGVDIVQREATPEEAEAFAPRWGGVDEVPDAPLPESLAATSCVLVFHVPSPRVLSDGNRATRGFGAVLAFRPGEPSPFFESLVDDASAWRLPEERWSAWLLPLLRAESSS